MSRLVVAGAVVLLVSVHDAGAQPAKIYVEGGPKEMKEQVLQLLRASSDLLPVPYVRQPEANINLQKKGGANVKCGSAKAFLPGPTASDIVAQFRAWVPGPLAARRTAHAARAEAWSRGLEAAAQALAAQNSTRATSSLVPSNVVGKLLLFGGENHKSIWDV